MLKRALFIVLTVAFVARAESVSLSVAPQTKCVSEDSLRAALSRAGLELVESGGLDVDVSGSGDAVRLRARRVRDARLLVRTVPLRNGCDGLELALVALIREWASAPALGVSEPVAPAPAPVPAPVVVKKPSPRPVVVAPVKEEEPVNSSAPSAPSVEPVVVEPSVVAAAPVAVIPPAPATSASPGPSPQPSPRSAGRGSEIEIRGAVGAGVSSVINTAVTPLGVFTADVGFGRLGVSLDGALDANVTLISAPGQLSFSTQSLTLSARVRFGWERLHFDAGLGLRGFRITAAASGFTNNGSTALLGLGPALVGTAWLRLIGPLLLMLRGSAALRLPADQFVVAGGPTFDVGSVQVGVVLGLSIAWP
ncbi:MAG: hypothetical protein QM817_33630 [Archangium sp.]